MAFTFNGTGTMFYGHDVVDDGYIATEYFTVLWVPLLPIKSVVVTREVSSSGLLFIMSSSQFEYKKLPELHMPQVKKHLFAGYATVLLLIYLIPYLADVTRLENGQPESERRAIELHNSANARHEAGEHETAIRLFSLSLDQDPSDAITYFLRGICFEELDDYENALKDYSSSIHLDPSSSSYRISRANLYWIMSEFEIALSDYDSSIQIDSTNSVSWYHKGIMHYELEEYDYAIPTIERSLVLEPSTHEAHVYLGSCMLLSGDTANAIYKYRTYLSLVDIATDSLAMEVIEILKDLEE